MKEKLKGLISNKYLIAGTVATVVVIIIIVILLTSKNCSGSGREDGKTVNAEVTTTEKEKEEKKTTPKTTKETTVNEDTATVEETNSTQMMGEADETTHEQQTKKPIAGNTAVTNPVTQPSVPESTQPPATEPTQPPTPVPTPAPTQPTTEAKKRTRNTTLENAVWNQFGFESESMKEAWMGKGKHQMSKFFGELRSEAVKYCHGEYSSSTMRDILLAKKIMITDSGYPYEYHVRNFGITVGIEDVTGKTAVQIKKSIYDKIINEFVNRGFTFFDSDFVDMFFNSWQAFTYFEIYDEIDGTRKMHLVIALLGNVEEE